MSKRVKRIEIGKKLYSLNDIWRLCWRMAQDIKYATEDIPKAKRPWLKSHGFNPAHVRNTCFFCEWALQQKVPPGNTFCDGCPGKMVSPRFHCCRKSYHYCRKPKKFAAKIQALDIKRKAK